MISKDLLKNIIVQGTMMEVETEFYEHLVTESEKVSVGETDLLSRIASRLVSMCERGIMDPWNVDISSFARVLREILDEKFTDFAGAGYLMLSAWHLLYRKSEIMLRRASPEIAKEVLLPDLEEGFGFDVNVFNQENTDLEMPTQENDDVGIIPPMRHSETRKITLLDLLVALRKASSVSVKPFTGQKDEIVITPAQMEKIVEELHSEEPEKEIEALRQRIMANTARHFLMEETWGEGEERKAFLAYSMFLCRRKLITLDQKVDFGPIVVRVEKADA